MKNCMHCTRLLPAKSCGVTTQTVELTDCCDRFRAAFSDFVSMRVAQFRQDPELKHELKRASGQS